MNTFVSLHSDWTLSLFSEGTTATKIYIPISTSLASGNHKSLNIQGDFRYVIKVGLDEFKNWGEWFSIGIQMKNLCKDLEKQRNIFNRVPKSYPYGIRARITALSHGGSSTRFLADNPTILMVGGFVFVHGGILPKDGVSGT
ncbi:hypothetical protein AMTRI_Chr13g85540 [Amborella trichopoda]